jgi:predicted molibdopterin-dependent oxidoreductase YjgC
MGSNTIEHGSRRGHGATLTAMTAALGSAAATNPQRELLDAGCILLIGSNMAEAQPVMSYNIVRAVKGREVTLLVINPTKPTILGDLATLWLAPAPGTDAVLLSAMAKVILDEGLVDEAFIDGRTEGFPAWKLSVADLSVDDASAVTGVPAEQIIEAARLYARGGNLTGERPATGWPASALVFGTGLAQQETGEANVRAACNLALLTGNIGRPLAGVVPLRLEANDQGATDLGALSDRLPGGGSPQEAAARAILETLWLERWDEPGFGARRVEHLPEARGLRLDELWPAVASGQIRAMYVIGDDPALLDPGASALLQQLDLLVVQDTFLTATAQLADVVLPGTTAVEKNGTYTNNDRLIQRVKAVLAPVGQSRADDEIVRSIARRLGYTMPYREAAEVMAEIAQVVDSYRGVSYARLEQGGLAWPVLDADHPGTPVLYTERAATPSGRAAFGVVDPAAATSPDHDFPMHLTLGDSLFQVAGGALGRVSTNLTRLEGDARVEIATGDALRLGIRDGAWVEVVTPHGRLEARAMLTDGSVPGRLYIDAQWNDASGTLLMAVPGTVAPKASPARLAVLPQRAGDERRLLHAGTGRGSAV